MFNKFCRKRNRRLMSRILAIATAVLMGIGCCACGDSHEQADASYLAGKGTLDEPYLVNTVDDLEWLSLQVNSGTEFEGVYFEQTSNLDFDEYGNWTPIGAYDSGHVFRGIYDGRGYSIQNITINGNELSGSNVGLFGVLAGTVCNLKIESGEISGACIGSISSHGTIDAVIANCYNGASLIATTRCGGIADNLGGGKIISCVNYGNLTCDVKEGIGGISSYSAGEVYACYSTENPTSEVFTGQVYRTKKVKDVYPGIADGDLEKVQELFADDLKGVSLVSLKEAKGETKQQTKQQTNQQTKMQTEQQNDK